MSPFLPPHQQYDFAPIGSPHLSIRTDDLEYGAGVSNDYWTAYYSNHCYSPVPQYYGPFHDAIVHHVDPAATNAGLDWRQGEPYQTWPNDKMTSYVDTNSVNQHHQHIIHHHHSLEHRFSDEDAFAMASLRASSTVGEEESYAGSHTPDPSLGQQLERENEDFHALQRHLPTKRNLRKRISLTPLESVGIRKRISPVTGKGKSAARQQQGEAAGKSTALPTPSTPSPTILPDRFSACIPCRRRKIKCVPRGDSHAYHRNGSNDGVCATCIRRRKDCFWPKLNLSGSTSQDIGTTLVAHPSSPSSSSSSSSSLSAPSSSLSPIKSRPPHRLATTRDYSSADEDDNDEKDNEEDGAERRTASPSLRPLPSMTTTMTMIKEVEERPVALQESHLPSVVESHFGLPKYAFGRSISSTSLSSSTSTPRQQSPSLATTSTVSTYPSSLHLLPSSTSPSSSSFSLSTPLSPLPPHSPAWSSLHFLKRELMDADNTVEAHYNDDDDGDTDNAAALSTRYPLVSSPSIDMTRSLGLEADLHSHSPPPFFPVHLSS